MIEHPKIDNAPGLVWRPRQGDWYAYWLARSDLVARGFAPPVVPMWKGGPLNEFEIARIQTECQKLQADMLIWGRGGLADPISCVTLKDLMHRYEIDEFSNFPKLRHDTRVHYKLLMKVLTAEHGEDMVAHVRGPILMRWHEGWKENRGETMARSLMRMLRTLFSFGFTILENKECERLCAVMSKMRFRMPQRRTSTLSADQATAIRAHAHTTKWPSIALGQAFQFDCLLRQKDVIGEWLPLTEPGMSDIAHGKKKWLRGIRWEEIDDALVLRHVTSKRGKTLEVPLRLCPMVMEELTKLAPGLAEGGRSVLPAAGPILIMDRTGRPWNAIEYRNRWRKFATAAGVPTEVYNMDSRAGGITEASDAGAPMEHIRHAATHSDISTTQGYSRGGATKTANVLEMRAAYRKNAPKT